MKRLALLLLLPLAILVGYYVVYPMYQVYSLVNYKQYDYDWNQKLTLQIDTPNGPVSASSVSHMGVEYYPDGLPLAGTERSYHLTGEAVAADLGDGRYLFALLPGDEMAEHAYWDFFGDDVSRGALLSHVRDQVGQLPRPVPPDFMPLLVTFDDLSDPASVRRVDPADLAATFGVGFALKGITLEITDAPVTEGVVEGVLGWLEEVGRERTTFIPNPPRHSSDAKDPDIEYLSSGAFSTELYK